MSTRRGRGNRQGELFRRSIKPVITIAENHRLVELTDELDWTELELVVEEIRRTRPADVREVQVVEEDVRFGLPRELEEMARRAGKTLPPRSGTAAATSE